VARTVSRIAWFLRWGADPSSFQWITREPHRKEEQGEATSERSKGRSGDPRAAGSDDDADDEGLNVPLNDPDDPHAATGTLHIRNLGKGSSQHNRALLEAGEHPEQQDPQTTIELADDETAAGISRAGAPEKVNQLLPWSYDTLSAIEIARTLRGLATVRNPELTETELRELRALAECMLWTGLSLTQSLSLTVRSQGTEPTDSELSICIEFDQHTDASSAVWRIKALTPHYQSVLAAVPGERRREDFIEFVDLGGAHQAIQDAFRSNALGSSPVLQPHARFGLEPYKLFQRDPRWYKRELKSILKEIDETGRITPGRLSKTLFQRIVECSGGDITAAAIITRTNHYLISARIFYSTPSAERLTLLHRMSTESLIAELSQGGWTRTVFLPPVPPNTDYAVGSRLCPTLSATQLAIGGLKNKLRRRVQLVDDEHRKTEFMAKHNWYSLYSVWVQIFFVGTRGILTPYVHVSEFDEATHLATIADKDSGNDYKRRLIWVPDIAWEQMAHYERYLHRAHEVHGLPKPTRKLPCYFVGRRRNGQFTTVKIRPASIKKFFGNVFPFPANFARRFMRTELLESNCIPANPLFFPFPAEFADCWMSHHFRGEEPWGPYSSFSYSNYLRQLNSYFEEFLEKLGFEAISMEPIA
jgi:hypothetical protein